ncbi:Solute carrier family 35 member G1 [Halotydeus destructor]|nr:Solute carrier family 35 member G1 [Halotydeus destructor]
MNQANEEGALVKKLRKIPLAGLLMAIFSATIFATASFMVKLAPGVPSVEVVVTRSIIQFACVSPYILYKGMSFKGGAGEASPLFIRGVLGFLAFSLAYSAFHLLPLGDASTIIFSAPVYVSIFACLMLGEACGAFHALVIVFTLSGVLLISKPTFIFGIYESKAADTFRVEGIIVSFLASLSQALSFIYMRRLQKTPAVVVIAWLSGVSIVMGVITLAGLKVLIDEDVKWPTEFSQTEWLCLIVNGLCGVFGQLCLTIACKIEEAGFVSLARTFDIVMAFIYQVSFLGEAIHWTSLLGATIVMSGVAVSATRKVILDRRAAALREADGRQIQIAPVVTVKK